MEAQHSPQQDPQPVQPTYMGMTAEQITTVARGAAGLDRPTYGKPDALTSALDGVLGAAIQRNAEGMTSNDQTDRARATRFFGALTTTALRSMGVESSTVNPSEENPDERFARLSLSGEEARASLAEVLGGIKSEPGDKVRAHFSVPPSDVEGPVSKEDQREFKPEEEGVAALVLATCLEGARVATEQNKLLRPEVLWSGQQTRAQVESAVLANDNLATGTPDERRAIVASVYAKLPTLMREAFERQQAALREMERTASKL